MSRAGQGTSWGVICVVVFLFALLLQFCRNVGEVTNAQPEPLPDRASFEHRYVQERFRQEGYNRSEAAQAADAIIKFQRAQEARR